MPARFLTLFLALTLVLGVARADTVVLTNGNEFEGQILEDSERRVVIEVRGGKLTFPRHLVKSVTKSKPKPKPKPKPRSGGDTGAGGLGPSSWGKGRNYWRDHQGKVEPGEVWVFDTRRRGEKKKPFDQIQLRLEVERVGLDGVHFVGRPKVRDSKTYAGMEAVRRGIFSDVWVMGLGGEGSSPNPAASKKLRRMIAAGKDVTLELAGRKLPCKKVVSRRETLYLHYRDGEVRWPGMVAGRFGGNPRRLIKIEPPSGKVPQPPRDPGARAGDRLTFEDYRFNELQVETLAS